MLLPVELYREVVDAMPILCVDLVLRDPNGKYLLVKRKNEPAKDRWWIPGGRLLKGETLEQGAVRQARKELGLEIKALAPMGYYERHWQASPFGLESGHHTVSLVFAGRMLIRDSGSGFGTGAIILDDQHSEWGFFGSLPLDLEILPFGVANAGA